MKLLQQIVWQLENKVFPAIKYLDNPISFPIDEHTKISTSKSGNCVTIISHMWTDEHLMINTVESGTLIEHKITFNGEHLETINNSLNKLISSTIKDITSKDHKKKLLTQRIKDLNEELFNLDSRKE